MLQVKGRLFNNAHSPTQCLPSLLKLRARKGAHSESNPASKEIRYNNATREEGGGEGEEGVGGVGVGGREWERWEWERREWEGWEWEGWEWEGHLASRRGEGVK